MKRIEVPESALIEKVDQSGIDNELRCRALKAGFDPSKEIYISYEPGTTHKDMFGRDRPPNGKYTLEQRD